MFTAEHSVKHHSERLQAQRYELKYRIEERITSGIRDFISSYLELDEYGAPYPDHSYRVHSVYLDSPDLKLYQATINGDKNRYKLRFRFYDDDSTAPVFCEIKRRTNNVIAKQRGAVRRSALAGMLAGQPPERDQLLSGAPKQVAALEQFCRLASQLPAWPRAAITYRREAWIDPRDNSVRVTFDREVFTELAPGLDFDARMIRPVSVFDDMVVLELKFTTRFPNWFGDLVRVFNLTQCSAAKYADGVTRLGPDAVSRALVGNGACSVPTERNS